MRVLIRKDVVDSGEMLGQDEGVPVTLYRRQRQIIDFLVQYIQRNGYSPTLQDIATAIGVSSLATVHEHLAALVSGPERTPGSSGNGFADHGLCRGGAAD